MPVLCKNVEKGCLLCVDCCVEKFVSIAGRVYCATESSCSRKNGRLESSLRAEIGEKVLFLKQNRFCRYDKSRSIPKFYL